jgi:hypothetical protein
MHDVGLKIRERELEAVKRAEVAEQVNGREAPLCSRACTLAWRLVCTADALALSQLMLCIISSTFVLAFYFLERAVVKEEARPCEKKTRRATRARR